MDHSSISQQDASSYPTQNFDSKIPPYSSLPPLASSKASETASTSSSGAPSENNVRIYGVGNVPIQPTSVETSPEVQQEWNKLMTELLSTLSYIATQEPSVSQLNDLVRILNDLATLATEGITGADGKTYYLTENMAEALNSVFYQFAQVGITLDLDPTKLSSSEQISLLNGVKLATASSEDPLMVAVQDAATYTYEDLGFQTYAYTTMMDLINGATGDLEILSDVIQTSNDVQKTLNTLVKISSYITQPVPWIYDSSLSSPGAIPPDVVPDIQKYIEENDGNDEECQFQEIYNQEYAEAEKRAAQNGTTVQEEMNQAALYPPHVDANGNPTGVPTSSELLTHFMGNEGDSERIQGINKIILDYSVQEIEPIPTAPDGKTMAEVGVEIWDAKESLETLITELTSQGADEELIQSLQTIVNSIDTLWAEALSKNGLPSTLTPEEAMANGQTKVLEDFASSYILSSQQDEPGGVDLNTAVQQFQSWSEELQKEFQQDMLEIENMVKFLSKYLEMMNNIASAYIKRYAG